MIREEEEEEEEEEEGILCGVGPTGLFLRARARRSADDRLQPDKRRDNSSAGEVKRLDRKVRRQEMV